MLGLRLPEKLSRGAAAAAKDLHAVTAGPVAADSVEDPAVAQFLDDVVQRLAPLTDDARTGIRQELRVHLEALIAAHEEMGDDHETSIAAAIRQVGDPQVIAKRFRHAWATSGPNKHYGIAKEAARNAALATSIGCLSYAALGAVCKLIFNAHRSGGAGNEIILDCVLIPLVADTCLLVPILIGRQHGKRWHQSNHASPRFWIDLISQVGVWSIAQQVLYWMLVLGWHFRLLANWVKVDMLKDTFYYSIPLAILAAILTRHRQIFPAVGTSLWAYVAFAGWILIGMLEQMSCYPYTPITAHMIPIVHAIGSWYLPWVLALVLLFGNLRRWVTRRASGVPAQSSPLIS